MLNSNSSLPCSLPILLSPSLPSCLPACLPPYLPTSLPPCVPPEDPCLPCLPASLPLPPPCRPSLPPCLPACLRPCRLSPSSVPPCRPSSLPAGASHPRPRPPSLPASFPTALLPYRPAPLPPCLLNSASPHHCTLRHRITAPLHHCLPSTVVPASLPQPQRTAAFDHASPACHPASSIGQSTALPEVLRPSCVNVQWPASEFHCTLCNPADCSHPSHCPSHCSWQARGAYKYIFALSRAFAQSPAAPL